MANIVLLFLLLLTSTLFGQRFTESCESKIEMQISMARSHNIDELIIQAELSSNAPLNRVIGLKIDIKFHNVFEELINTIELSYEAKNENEILRIPLNTKQREGSLPRLPLNLSWTIPNAKELIELSQYAEHTYCITEIIFLD